MPFQVNTLIEQAEFYPGEKKFSSFTPVEARNPRRPLLFMIGAALMLGACDKIPGTNDYQINLVETYLRRFSNDPSAVQFRDTAVYANGVVCGAYNDKNPFGAYVGFLRFVAEPPRSYDEDVKNWHVEVDNQFNPSQAAYADTMCKSMSSGGPYLAAGAAIACQAALQQTANKASHDRLEADWAEKCK